VKVGGLLDRLELQEGCSVSVEKRFKSQEPSEPSIRCTRSVGSTRGSAYREFARRDSKSVQRKSRSSEKRYFDSYVSKVGPEI
jgi:hypothetical protein